MDMFGAVAIALLLFLGRSQITHTISTLGAFVTFVAAVFKTVQSGAQVRRVQ